MASESLSKSAGVDIASSSKADVESAAVDRSSEG